MSDIANEIQANIQQVQSMVESGQMSQEDGVALLEEWKDTYKQLETAEAEIAVRYLVQAISIISKFVG
jgi:hypothetical protein